METPNGRVRWSLWSSGFGFVTQGQMQLCKVTEKLQKFEQAAKQLLAPTMLCMAEKSTMKMVR